MKAFIKKKEKILQLKKKNKALTDGGFVYILSDLALKAIKGYKGSKEEATEFRSKLWFNPVQHGGGAELGVKRPPTSFSPVTSANVQINIQSLFNFSFNPFDTLV